jgi:hypothetical protein
LRILLAKKFIHQLNDDLVVFVTDWREHNFIRADRKTDSVYKDLLLQVVPEAHVIQPKPRTDVRDNSRRMNQQPYLQPMDSLRTVHGRHRLGKVRLSNVNGTKEEKEGSDERKTLLHQLPNIEQPSEETRLIANDILVALGDQHSQTFLCSRGCEDPRKCYSPETCGDKTREDTLTSKSVYQRNEEPRRHHAPKAKGVCGLVVQTPPVSD